MKNPAVFDVIIVGGSYAGLAAAMALGRGLRQVLVVDDGNPCNQQTPHSHNFLTNDGRKPNEIAAMARREISNYSTVQFLNARATKANKTRLGFVVTLQTGEIYEAKKLVFATGIKDILPSIPGIAECWGISVLHCPYCHGYEVRGQKTGVLANGDKGYELASLIANWTADLTLFTNGPSALATMQENKLQKHNIAIDEREIERIEHENGYVKNIVYRSGQKETVSVLYAKLPFEQHSDIPRLLGCELTADGYIKIDSLQRTSVPGVFACGDNVTRMRTVANAVAMGTTTGIMVNKEIVEEEF